MNDKTLVIGGGCMGINLCMELIKRGNKVDLITDSFNSISYRYAVGLTKVRQLPKIIITNNIDWGWLLLYRLIHNSNKYIDERNKLFKASLKGNKLLNENTKVCKDSYKINFKKFLDESVGMLKRSSKFNYVITKINNVDKMAKFYKHVYVCVGSNADLSVYNSLAGGIKAIIKSNKVPKCMNIEDGFITLSENGKLIVLGGLIFGDKVDNKKLVKILKDLPLWDKYGCKKILQIDQDYRSLSLDTLPFYFTEGNVTHIRGDSFAGCSIAPAVVKSILDGEDRLHRNRFKYKFICRILMVLAIIVIVKVGVGYVDRGRWALPTSRRIV